MSDKPSYLGLLNAISNAETRAHCYLTAWAETTPSADVRGVLLKIAAREGEHGMTFARRINELGYELRTKPDADLDKTLAFVRSDRSDLEKMKKLKLHKLDTGSDPDIFDNFFNDHTIDIRTGELLGRYIAEERDSARLFRSCYEQLVAAEAGDRSSDSNRVEALEAKVDALRAVVDDLRSIVAAEQPANGSARRTREKSAKKSRGPATTAGPRPEVIPTSTRSR